MPSPAFLTRKISIPTTTITLLRQLISPLSSQSLLRTSLSSLCKRPLSPPPPITPPIPKKIPFKLSAHGKTWDDPYHWMSNTQDPDLINHLNQENLYADAFMSDTQNLQKKLVSEMISRMPPEVSTPPERWGPWFYYQYIPEGKEYPVLCRQLQTHNDSWVGKLLDYVRSGYARQEILLDWNEVSEQFGYVHIGTCRVSPDHNFLAYTLDTTGGEEFMLQIKDLRTGCVFSNSRVDAVVSLAWSTDSQNLFYTVSDETQRPFRVLCTKLGSHFTDAVPIFTESDPTFCVDITSTKDCEFITINSNSRSTSEVYVIDANKPLDGLQKVRMRVHGTQYFVEHHYGIFYILTNAPLREDDNIVGGSYYLVRCRASDIQSAVWQNIILPGEDVSFQDMDIFNGHLVLFLDKGGSSMICSIAMPIDVN